MTESTLVTEPGNGTLEVFPLPADTGCLHSLLRDVFENYWDQIHFGPAVQGAVWEVRAPNAPKRIDLFDGYLTVDFGHWHFHLCIGENKGTHRNATSPELAHQRRTARAELYRRLHEDGRPSSWGLRLFNGRGDQQMTVFLPNPYLSVEQKVLKEPRWENLAMWDHLRKTYLGLEADPLDREASRNLCA
jgi:hypothetical protein